MKRRGKHVRLMYRFILLALSASVFGVALVMSLRILPGVRLGSVDVGSLTQEQAFARFSDAVSREHLTLAYGSRTWQPTFSDLGVTYDARQAVRNAYSVGRGNGVLFAWRTVALKEPLEIPYALSDEVLQKYLERVSLDIGPAPANAFVKREHGAFIIVPDRDGVILDAAALKEQMSSSLHFARQARVELKPTVRRADITAADLQNLVADAEAIANVPVKVTIQGKTFNVDRDRLMEWLEFLPMENGSGALASIAPVASQVAKATLDLDEKAIRSYLESVSQQVNVAPEEQHLLKSTNKVEVLKAGKSGKALALEASALLLKEHILTKSTAEIELLMVEVPPPVVFETPPTAPVSSGKVITVDVTKLLEYVYEDGVLVYSSKVSTGIPSKPTPIGTFHVYAKVRKQKMSGPGYYLPNVPWILWFKGDYSLHGTYWHNDFGIRARSHGCVNEPLKEAEWIFNWAEVGTPVVIYKT